MSLEKESLTRKIGLRIRAARHANHWSLSELSDRTGGELSKSRISNYEQGIRRPSIETAELLAHALGTISTIEILCLDEINLFTADEQQLLACYRNTDARGQALILQTATAQQPIAQAA